MADSFLGRWSQRKRAVQRGLPVLEPVVDKPQAAAPNAAADTEAANAGQAPVALSMEDVSDLTPASDFAPFVARGVVPEVRNAAMKKLFADPQFNVMDGMDVYIDDYSIADPLPESVLRQMVSAKFLKLFEEEKEPPVEPGQDHEHIDLRLQPDHAAPATKPERGTE